MQRSFGSMQRSLGLVAQAIVGLFVLSLALIRNKWGHFHHFLHFPLNISFSHKKKFHRSTRAPQLVEHSLCVGDISSMADDLVS
ncbi:hypothetical protein N1851_029826 [Merluccius polli]|uniref:Uncharacterized protein n=1 Tax=Merluccius polli TaxID=89951 RepID=A0AA47NSC1_MERPO|nr:hypothetical protein N1851_029826 [Merluccius polli]